MAEETGFTVKEMLIRLDTKVDLVIADHERRIRALEKEANESSGQDTGSEKLTAKRVSWAAVAAAAASWITQIVAAYPHK